MPFNMRCCPLRVSIHAPHEGERQADITHNARRKCVSIHAPHEGERPRCLYNQRLIRAFQSTLPTRGSDDLCFTPDIETNWFQSTLPTRGSDEWPLGVFVLSSPVSIHAPHEGERHHRRDGKHRRQRVSIHAPHEGERRPRRLAENSMYLFQSTLPTRGSDLPRWSWGCVYGRFNPRSPRGGATAFATAHTEV